MYQYSLGWFLNLFIQTILKSPKSDDLETRLKSLIDFFTKAIYENVCRSLFEKDKLVFSFVLCIGILKAKGIIQDDELSFFLTGGVALENPYQNPASEWLTDKSWAEIVRASALPSLTEFRNSVTINVKKWKNYYDLSDPENNPIPEPFTNAEYLKRLIILKCLRSDKVVPALRLFIIENMGQAFVEAPRFNLKTSFEDSSPKIPLIFILSPGSDPMDNLMAFSNEKYMGDE